MIKKKWDDTDFKGGASKLGDSIADSSKKTGSKISSGWTEMKNSEKTANIKRGFTRFTSKVKGWFSKKDSDEEEEKKEPVPVMAEANVNGAKKHNTIKAEMMGSDNSDEEENIPEMMRLEGHSDDGGFSDEDNQFNKDNSDSDED